MKNEPKLDDKMRERFKLDWEADMHAEMLADLPHPDTVDAEMARLIRCIHESEAVFARIRASQPDGALPRFKW